MNVEFLFDFISPYAYLAYHGVGSLDQVLERSALPETKAAPPGRPAARGHDSDL